MLLCVGYNMSKGKKTKPHLFNILGNNRDAKLSVRTLRGEKNVTRCMFSLAIVSRKKNSSNLVKFLDVKSQAKNSTKQMQEHKCCGERSFT